MILFHGGCNPQPPVNERTEEGLSNEPLLSKIGARDTENEEKQASLSTATAHIHKRENVQLCENFRTPLHPLFRRARFFAHLNKFP
jgi:hypothetical protein